MRILSFSLKLILLAVVATFMMPGCKDDTIPPDTATIHGTITLDSAYLWDTWKDKGVVEISLFPEFVLAAPPAGKGWGYIPSDFYGPGSLDGMYPISAPTYVDTVTYAAGKTLIAYELKVQPGTYSALALGFRNDLISDPTLKSATLGVYWAHPTEVSHGILIKADVGGGQIVTFFDDPAPSIITVAKGDNVEFNFRADFSFVNAWYH